MASELATLRSNGNAQHNGNGTSLLESAESTALTDRRGMMKKMAGLAVGVAAVGLRAAQQQQRRRQRVCPKHDRSTCAPGR
jgi:hypothetical protein